MELKQEEKKSKQYEFLQNFLNSKRNESRATNANNQGKASTSGKKRKEEDDLTK